MYTITFKPEDRDKVLEIFGTPESENGSTITFQGMFRVDMMETSTKAGLPLYVYDASSEPHWEFASDGKSYALKAVTDSPDTEDSIVYEEMLGKARALLEERHETSN